MRCGRRRQVQALLRLSDDAPATEGDVWDALFADEPAMVMDDDDVA